MNAKFFMFHHAFYLILESEKLTTRKHLIVQVTMTIIRQRGSAMQLFQQCFFQKWNGITLGKSENCYLKFNFRLAFSCVSLCMFITFVWHCRYVFLMFVFFIKLSTMAFPVEKKKIIREHCQCTSQQYIEWVVTIQIGKSNVKSWNFPDFFSM